MKLTKVLALLIMSAFLIVPVEAGNNAAKKKQQEKEKKREERAKKRDALEEFMGDRDKNNDGSLTKDEFLSGETDKDAGSKKFDRFNKNGDRALTKAEISDMLGL